MCTLVCVCESACAGVYACIFDTAVTYCMRSVCVGICWCSFECYCEVYIVCMSSVCEVIFKTICSIVFGMYPELYVCVYVRCMGCM